MCYINEWLNELYNSQEISLVVYLFSILLFWCILVHVAEHMDCDDPGYVEALENETAILEKRVTACKSRIMFVTVFDVSDEWL